MFVAISIARLDFVLPYSSAVYEYVKSCPLNLQLDLNILEVRSKAAIELVPMVKTIAAIKDLQE